MGQCGTGNTSQMIEKPTRVRIAYVLNIFPISTMKLSSNRVSILKKLLILIFNCHLCKLLVPIKLGSKVRVSTNLVMLLAINALKASSFELKPF